MENKKDSTRGDKYLFERSKAYRFNQIIKDKKFLTEQKDLLKKIKPLNKKNKEFRTFAFSLRWGISWKVDPKKSYKENNHKLGKEMLFPPPVSLELDAPILDCYLNGKFAIDLRYPERAITRSFEEQLKQFRDVYKREIKKPGRTRLDKYEGYVKVYRLHENGWSWVALANKFYKDEPGGLNYAKQKVKRDYERGQKLVESGFRQIR